MARPARQPMKPKTVPTRPNTMPTMPTIMAVWTDDAALVCTSVMAGSASGNEMSDLGVTDSKVVGLLVMLTSTGVSLILPQMCQV